MMPRPRCSRAPTQLGLRATGVALSPDTRITEGHYAHLVSIACRPRDRRDDAEARARRAELGDVAGERADAHAALRLHSG
jgi:hypothetical protein